MMNLWTDLIFPLIYTIIGALIGGYFAYKIAKLSFLIDRTNQGNECIELIKIRVDLIKEKSESTYAHVRSHSTCNKAGTFLDNLFTFTSLLEPNLSSFLSYWESHRDIVLLCCTKRFCRNQKKRSQYKAFETAVRDLLPDITHYQLLVKQYAKIYHEATKPGRSEESLQAFLKGHESSDILNQAAITLNALASKCIDIQNAYNALNSK